MQIPRINTTHPIHIRLGHVLYGSHSFFIPLSHGDGRESRLHSESPDLAILSKKRLLQCNRLFGVHHCIDSLRVGSRDKMGMWRTTVSTFRTLAAPVAVLLASSGVSLCLVEISWFRSYRKYQCLWLRGQQTHGRDDLNLGEQQQHRCYCGTMPSEWAEEKRQTHTVSYSSTSSTQVAHWSFVCYCLLKWPLTAFQS